MNARERYMTVALLVWRWLRYTLSGRRELDCWTEGGRKTVALLSERESYAKEVDLVGHRGIRCFVCGREVDDCCAGVGGGREVDYC